MARFNNIVDLGWKSSGDFSLSETGDIADTKISSDKYRAFNQIVKTLLQSSTGDWVLERIGVNAKKIVGLKNTPETGALLQNLITSELLKDNLVKASELNVEVVPVSKEVLMALITIRPIGSNEKMLFTYSYDLRSNQVVRS